MNNMLPGKPYRACYDRLRAFKASDWESVLR